MHQHYRCPVSAFALACQLNSVLVENVNAGVDAYETLQRGRIKGATKAKSECVGFPLALTRTHKRRLSFMVHCSPCGEGQEKDDRATCEQNQLKGSISSGMTTRRAKEGDEVGERPAPLIPFLYGVGG